MQLSFITKVTFSDVIENGGQQHLQGSKSSGKKAQLSPSSIAACTTVDVSYQLGQSTSVIQGFYAKRRDPALR